MIIHAPLEIFAKLLPLLISLPVVTYAANVRRPYTQFIAPKNVLLLPTRS
jgi:hypothetical protein